LLSKFISTAQNKLIKMIQANPEILVKPLFGARSLTTKFNPKVGPYFETILN
jgi:hypothetical protein